MSLLKEVATFWAIFGEKLGYFLFRHLATLFRFNVKRETFLCKFGTFCRMFISRRRKVNAPTFVRCVKQDGNFLHLRSFILTALS